MNQVHHFHSICILFCVVCAIHTKKKWCKYAPLGVQTDATIAAPLGVKSCTLFKGAILHPLKGCQIEPFRGNSTLYGSFLHL